jgi:uncharacterized protein YecE (DUF72 family)
MAIHVGIGSWADDDYVGVLYPKGLPAKERLREYTRSFEHVEVNSSYYATPRPDTVKTWLDQTPKGFTFSIKLHRAFSQSPAKTAEKGELLPRLLEAVEPLRAAKRLATFFLVLPPSFTPEKKRLEDLDTLAELLAGPGLAVELRDRAWVTGKQRDATLKYFRSRKLIWIAVDMPKIAGSSIMPAVDEVTHPSKAYMRLHGRNPGYLDAKSAAEGHHYAYKPRELDALAARAKALAEKAKDVYVIANNHAEDFAPKAALELRRRLAAPKKPSRA